MKIIAYLQKNWMLSSFTFFICCCIGFSLFQSSWFVRHNDIMFNTDIARDFLLLEDTITTHKLPLIGPRSGGIPGIFHGPLWLYSNLPAYVLGKGNPVSVGWFWVFLTFLNIMITYYAGRKLFSHITGLLGSLLVALFSVGSASSLFNPYGAVILSPLFFLLLINYLKKDNVRDLVLMLFILGCIIQFQIAFGGPILFLSCLWLLVVIIRKRNFSHFFSFLVLLIPFATYILFDVRHQFLEIHALGQYFTHKSVSQTPFHINIFADRLSGITNSLSLVSFPFFASSILWILFWVFITIRSTQKSSVTKNPYVVFAYLFIGYWLLTLGFRGVVWSYYYWPFLPIVCILFAASYRFFPKLLFGILLLYIFIVAQQQNAQALTRYQSFSGKDTGSWLFNLHLAQTVFEQHDKQFGYYIFSPDEFGYSPRYAMHYVAKTNPSIQADPYKKNEITYLLIAPLSGENNAINGTWWKTQRVHITTEPLKVWHFSNGFSLEEYELDAAQRAIPSDPNLIDSLLFR